MTFTATVGPVDQAVARPSESLGVVDLARRLHDTVAQRLAGVAYLLAADDPFEDGTLGRCRLEVETALEELREALASVATTPPSAPRVELDTQLQALLAECPAAQLLGAWDDAARIGSGGLVESFLVEALRNVRKHARPTRVGVEVVRDRDVTVIAVANDGVARRAAPSCGVGRRLLEVEASLHGALVDFGPAQPGWWSQRLILPAGTAAAA